MSQRKSQRNTRLPRATALTAFLTSSPSTLPPSSPHQSHCLLSVLQIYHYASTSGPLHSFPHSPGFKPPTLAQITSFFFFFLWWILSYLEMKQPRVYMCSPSQSPLPPPSPPTPSRFSQCTRSERLSHASNLGW